MTIISPTTVDTAVTAQQHTSGQAGHTTLVPFDATKTLDSRTLAHWGVQVDLDGIDAHEDVADILVDAATRRGVRPVLVEVLKDRNEPSVARTRAFGYLTLALGK